MLKFAKKFLMILGAVVIVAAAIYLLYEFWLSADSVKTIVQSTINYGTKGTAYDATMTGIVIGALIGIVGGIVLGIGIGIPSATFKERYEQRQAEVAQKLAETAHEQASSTSAEDAAPEAPSAA